MPPGPWLKEAELFVRRQVVRAFGAVVHRRAHPPRPDELTAARVLLIRQDRIGDVLISTPLIAALTAALPALRIDLLLSTNNVAARPGLPGVGEVWVYERTFASMVSLLRQIRAQRYDVAVDLMDNPSATSTAFCVLSGARWTVGLEKENDYSYDVRVRLRSRRDFHIIERLSPLAEVFGVPAANAESRVVYQPSVAARQEAERVWASMLPGDRSVIGVNISAGSERRYWGTARYQRLLEGLAARHPGTPVAVLCKPEDSSRASEIAHLTPGALVVPPSRSFEVFAAVVSRLQALITPDTSVVHLASAFGIPSVVMYIQSNAELRIWEPYGVPHVPVVTPVDDLGAISVEQVLSAWDRLPGRNLPTRSL